MNETPRGRDLNRRRFLSLAGLGAGTLAVAAGTASTWYAIDRGVFTSETGPAYAAWEQAGPVAGDPRALVNAAVLAANAHNSQPWLFRVAPDRIDVFADTSRTLGAIDPLLRELHISLGCAIENLLLAAPSNGLRATAELMPDPAQPRHVARVTLAGSRPRTAELFPYIAGRHTDRGAYDTGRPVPRRVLDQLGGLAGSSEDGGVELVWFDDGPGRQAFGDLTVRATRAVIADRQQTTDDFAWYRGTRREIQARKDGVTVDASGQPRLIRTLAKLLPASHSQNNDGWLRGTAETQVPTAAAFGALLTRDPLDPVQRLRTGRAWQRLHLWATANGLAMQPLCQIPERIDRERSAGLPPEFTTAAATLFPPGLHPLMTFRIGYPTAAAPPSPRRLTRDVLLG
ncbi:Tat pathway signal protein [Acrocarpospora phusangensis]|uniref:Tat pathway signal protein n=1 Tax=Acrocarpospora phusangensis TaxID=1070424 RepID=A0A919Q5Q8_9ACTN|nr:hypothetical protein [Acrocarpospora phusangensis]GIH21729.1 Tat pathway signal protein [Acrocarpospora phusangensis]